MARNIVICCDGTANEFARDATNVVRLFSALVQDPERQIACYHPGLGTMEAAAALTSPARRITRLLGKAIGYGLESDVRDIYGFLMRFHAPGDRVFLFGFSRGAYTVRAVAALVHLYGLLRPGQEPMIPYAIRLMNALHRQEARMDAAGLLAQAAEFRTTFQPLHCVLHFAGVWDTVSSVGWVENPLRLPFTANNPSIRIGRHAVAIDERRAFFRTNLWRPARAPDPAGPADLKQVWFPGVHCDIGGGYAEAEGGLSKITLEWMASEAHQAGLLLDRQRLVELLGAAGDLHSPPDPNAIMHESLTPGWWPAELIPKRHYNWNAKREERRMNLGRRRTVPEGALVHEVAWRRRGYVLPPGTVAVVTAPIAWSEDGPNASVDRACAGALAGY